MESPRRRSVYADRLKPFAGFALGDDAIFTRRGRWAAFLRERIGPAFDGHVVLEIGCADGDFLTRLAIQRPTTAFVGLDWKHKSLFLAAERAERAGLQNVALLRGRGQDLAAVFGPGEIDEILLFHPDPFALPAERANRVFAEPFLIAAHAVLRDGTSTLTLKTDHPGYYAWALALFGLPEPAHFAVVRNQASADPSLTSKLIGEPRVRPADLLALADRPAPSAAAMASFEVAVRSANAWYDPSITAHLEGRVFAGERTFFEGRFLKKRQPIYYVELRKRGKV